MVYTEEIMGTQEFIVLYTHQKLKKAKVWQDGILKISHLGNKAILYDDKGQCLESIFLKCLEVKPGDDLEGDRYLITIEEVKVAGPAAVVQTVTKEASGSGRCVSSGWAQRCQPAGLKRKFNGFQGPRQVSPKIVVTENSELAASLEAKKDRPLFLSSFYDTSPLFSTAGQKDINNRPTDPENTVTYENRERNGMLPFSSSAISTPAFKIHPEMLGDGHYVCPPLIPENKRSHSFLTDEPVKNNGLTPRHSGVPQNIRSKAQILALLKSKSTSVCRELDSELREHCPQVQPCDSVTIPPQPGCSAEQEECPEEKLQEDLQYQQSLETTARKASRWAIYLPSQRSPEHSLTEEENDPAGMPKTQEGSLNLNRKDILAQNKKQFFETCAESGGECIEDNPIHIHDPSWDQEAELEIPSFKESSAPISCSRVENDSLLSESGIQENSKISLHQSNPICSKESLLIQENAEESRLGEPKEESEQGPELEHLQMEPSLRNNARVSDDITHMSYKNTSDNENFSCIPEFRDNVELPLVEVTFNLNNFESSDTEEESQESHKISQDSEGWLEETDGHSSCRRRREDASCKENGGALLPLLTSVRGTPMEPLSQFCDKTRGGFYIGPWKAGNTGKKVEQGYSDTLSSFDSSLEWPDDDSVDNNEEANQSKASVNNDFASLPSTSKRTETNLLTSHFSNVATNRPHENYLFSEQAQPFVWGNKADVNDEQVLLPSTSSCDEHVQLLSAGQNLSKEHVTTGKSHTRVSNSLLNPLGTKCPISKDTEAHIPGSKDLGRFQKLPHYLTEEEIAGGKQYLNCPKICSEPSGFMKDISLLKSLSEHSTALEGLEIMQRKNTTFKQQQSLQTSGPKKSPEAGGSLTAVASQAVPKPPDLNQDSQQMLKENEVEPAEPLQSLKFFSLENEEEPAFVTVTPKQIETAAYDSQPVEFQGHQVRGSAAGAVMVRGPSILQGHSAFPRSVQSENHMSGAWLLTPQVHCTGVQTDFLQFPNEGYSQKGGTSFNIEDNYQAITESEKDSFESDLMKKSRFLENKNPAGVPLVSRTQAPLTTLPPAPESPDFDSLPNLIHWDGQEAPGLPLLSLHEDSTFPTSGFGSENPREMYFPQASRAMTPRAASHLHKESAPSKWLKYQSITQGSMASPGHVESDTTDGLCTLHVSATGAIQHDTLHIGCTDSENLQRIKHMLHPRQQASSSQDLISGSKDFLEVNGSELCFPSGQKTKSGYLPQRRIHIPAVFQSPAQYKQIFTSCLIEHLNIMLFSLAQRLHRALTKVDISFYTSPKGEEPKSLGKNVPSCYHQQPAKLVMVKKDGPNKGRLFYACDGPKADQCKFFKWFEAVTPGYLMTGDSPPVKVLSDIKSIGLYLRSQKIPLYEECQLLVRKGFDFQRKQYGKLKKFAPINSEFCNNEPKSKLYLKLSRKESSSTYSKDDLWVVSKTLDFELDTFIACSAFFGPSSTNEVELLPLKGYFPSNWPTNTVVHALLVCNASTELTTLKNIQDHFNPATLPLTQFLLTMSSSTTVSNKAVSRRKFTPPAFSNIRPQSELLSLGPTLQLASELIRAHKLNKDQAAALTQIARMMAPQPSTDNMAPQTPACPITIIHGVFGAGKSYLLALVVLFFVQLFEKSESAPAGNARPWKVLISSSTNVAVDRVLLGLLSLGFEKFVRVGSIRKIAKPILPYSLHAGSENEDEQLKELQTLMREDLSPVEKVYVRKSIEQHKLGTNRTLLRQVRVVGVTCAACPFPCMNDLKFPVVVLDECSQITEPASLLPIARFECEKLILVGDPKQLPPTIQGSDAAHENGLEQTLFDRLCLMGHKPVLLRTQYRCHPAISAIVNDLFYEGHLLDGVTDAERCPLLAWLPTLCFYNVRGLEQMERDSSFHNAAEVAFTLKLIQSLIASGVAGSRIGVITLYKSQMHKLCQALSASDLEQPSLRAVQVSTVDAFQGAEKEVIILSCVRTRHVGFIDSERRMNVALTRGRRHLLIVGNLACLRENRLWGQVIQHCEGREGGLQHASQCEPQLDQLLKDYLEEQAAAKQKKKREKEKLNDDLHSQKAMV